MNLNKSAVKAAVLWSVVCTAADGSELWRDDGKNLVVNTGLDFFLSNALDAAGLYIGFTDADPTVAAADTMTSHAGWAEVTGYDETARQGWTQGAVASQSISNSASLATFTVTAETTVGGAFMSTDATKGGTTGTLFNAKAFAGNYTVPAGSTITVEVSVSVSSA